MSDQGKKIPNLHRSTRQIALCVASFLGLTAAHALEWQTSPTVSLMSTNDSNYRLLTSNEREVSSSRIDANASITGSSDRVTLELRPRVRAINFSDDREFDRTDQFLYSSVAVGSERQRVTLSADFVRDGTLTNALDDTGFTEVDAERDRSIFGLDWAAATSEFGTFVVALNSHTVEYRDELIASPLTDYDYASIALSYAHRLSERSTLTVSLTGGQLDTVSTSSDSDNVGLSVAFERALSDSLTMRIGAGQYETRRPDSFSSDERDSSLDFSLEKRWDRWTLTTGLSADVEPSAFGVLWRRETANVRIRRRFSERVDASLSLSSGQVEQDQQTLSFEDRRYGNALLNISLRVAERLWLSFDVGTRAQEFSDGPRARSTYGQVAFTYRGRGS